MSMPGPAPSVYSPFIRCGMPQANSTTSSPRWISPLVSAHSTWASLAFSTAARTSALEASATLACTSPVIGSKTSAVRPDVPFTSLPPMKCPMERMNFLPGIPDSRFTDLFDLHFLGYKSEILHHRCAEMLDQGGVAID